MGVSSEFRERPCRGFRDGRDGPAQIRDQHTDSYHHQEYADRHRETQQGKHASRNASAEHRQGLCRDGDNRRHPALKLLIGFGEHKTEQHRIDQGEGYRHEGVADEDKPIVAIEEHRYGAYESHDEGSPHRVADMRLLTEAVRQYRTDQHTDANPGIHQADAERLGADIDQMQLDRVLDAIEAEVDQTGHNDDDR